jgi:hypothetical protein
MDKRLRDRLVGGFGGGGGTMVLYCIFFNIALPAVRSYWSLWLTMAFIGVVFVSIAVYFRFKKVTAN